MTYKGKFKPRHPEKYEGDFRNITYRSGWELTVMNFLDMHPDVISWSSEELIIMYRSPLDGKMHRYYPDFKIKKIDRNGVITESIVEVKPKAQCAPPKVQQRKTRRYIKAVGVWGVNEAKWKAARAYAEARGWKFMTMTEEDIRKISNAN